MAGFSVVWNIVLAPYILKEEVSIHDLRGSAVILLGCIMVGVSGSHDTPKHSSSDIFALFTSAIFIEYAVCALVGAGIVSGVATWYYAVDRHVSDSWCCSSCG